MIELDTVFIEINDSCNLNCVHCMNRDYAINKSMSTDNIENIIKKLLIHNIKKIVLTGGEPLLAPEIIDIIKLCKNYPQISFLITTNGTLISEFIMLELNSSRNIGIQISVDGTTKEVFDKIRGAGSYTYFKKGYNLIANSNVTLKYARMCISKINCLQVGDFLIDSKKNGFIPSFVFVEKLGNAIKNWSSLILNSKEKRDIIIQIEKTCQENNIVCNIPNPPIQCNFTEAKGFKSFTIRSNGDVIICQQFYNTPIGNIQNSTVEEIMNSSKLLNIYDIAKKRKELMIKNKFCYNCFLKNICHFGCLGKARESNWYSDNLCLYRKEFFLSMTIKNAAKRKNDNI